MNPTQTAATRAKPEPLPSNIRSVQPGGGLCYRIELAWGHARRWYLRTFRAAYVRRMAQRLRGDVSACPHEVLDPRDLKYHANLCQGGWDTADDPFTWRQKIPFARWGLAELQLMGYPLLALALGGAAFAWYLALPPAILLVLVVYFFRDPPRRVPGQAGLIVAPADGKVVEVVRLEHDDFIGGPAVRIGIFLSIFNVHLNRSPLEARVLSLRYHPGRFLNAMNPASAQLNESMWIGLEAEQPPHRRLIVRQIAGLLARKIVCDLRPGQVVARGQKFGMIKLGSRTELVLAAADALEICVAVGQRVAAGATVVARYDNQGAGDVPAESAGE